MISAAPVEYTIIKAQYGNDDKQKDVTENLKKATKETSFDFEGGNQSFNSLFTDPAPGAKKDSFYRIKIRRERIQKRFKKIRHLFFHEKDIEMKLKLYVLYFSLFITVLTAQEEMTRIKSNLTLLANCKNAYLMRHL